MGMLLLHLNFGDLKNNLKIVNDAHNGIVPDKLITKKVRKLVEEMLSINPSLRPETNDIVLRLNLVIEKLRNKLI